MKQLSVVLIMLMLLVGLLAACGSTNNEEQEVADPIKEEAGTVKEDTPAEVETQEVVNLTIPVFPDDQNAFEEVYVEFKKEYPNINIEFVSFPIDQYAEKLRLELTAGAEYDLFAGHIDVMLDTGAMEPIDSYLQENNT